MPDQQIPQYDLLGALAATDLFLVNGPNLNDTTYRAPTSVVETYFDALYQPLDAGLTDIAALAVTDSNFIVGDGVNWVAESGVTARTSLGLGSIATQAANSVAITGGSITGITDLAIADGGTGQSTAQAAIDTLSAVAGATDEHVLTKDTATGNAVFKASGGGSSLPVVDTTSIVKGSVDNSREFRLEVDGFTPGVTRVGTPPDADFTLAGLEVAQIFTVAQTIDNSLIISTANGIDINPGSDIDTDLLSVGVTGAPVLSWDESESSFKFNTELLVDSVLRIAAPVTGNIAIGEDALVGLTTGNYNQGIGYNAGHSNTEGIGNIFQGYQAGYSNTAGHYNTFQGYQAGYTNITGHYNTFQGYQTGFLNTTGDYNIFQGFQAGYSNTTGDYNIFQGRLSGYSNTTGSYNIFQGSHSGNSNTDGIGNLFQGFQTGYSNTTGDYNIFQGFQTGYSNTAGIGNIFQNRLSGYSNTTGSYNIFQGYYSGRRNTTGKGNIFQGYFSGYLNTTGDYNVFQGYQAGYSNIVGSYSVGIGYKAGYNETGSNRLYISNSNTATPLIYGEFDNDLLKFYADNADTNVIHDVLYLVHNSSGIPAANFGTGLLFQGKSATTPGQNMTRLASTWATATHPTRKARGILSVYDANGEREGLRIEASGSAPMLGVLGASAIARQAHIVDADGTLADITTKFNSLLAYLENFGFIATS